MSFFGGGSNSMRSGNEGDASNISQSANTVVFDARENNLISNKIKVGSYRLKSESSTVKYVFIPSQVLSHPSFSFSDTFAGLGISIPKLMFWVNGSPEVDEWNVKLPPFKKSLENKTNSDSNLNLYQGVIEANIKRLLKGTANACEQANAIFRLDSNWIPNEEYDKVGEWVSDNAGDVSVLGVSSSDHFDKDFAANLIEYAVPYNPSLTEEDMELERKVILFDTKPFFDKTKAGHMDQFGKFVGTFPHPKLTHLIFSDDFALLEQKIEQIPTGLIIVQGGPNTTKQFCDAIQEKKPVFIFKYTGHTADLAIEMLDNQKKYIKNKTINPNLRPTQPFLSDYRQGYRHDRWLWPWDGDVLKSTKSLNILADNFPADWKESTVLIVDMFTMSEEDLQDKLTKTMSSSFEGVAELGGQTAENRRLTYAWRLRHKLNYNAKKQKITSDLFQVLIILLSFAAVCCAVFYMYCTLAKPLPPAKNELAIRILLALNLLLPLAVTILRGVTASMNPLKKWKTLSDNALKLESEIYLYRTKVGQYASQSQQSKSDKDKDKKKKNKNKQMEEDYSSNTESLPRKNFSNMLDEVWQELAASDISKGALSEPDHDDDPMEDILERLSSNTYQQDQLRSSLKARDIHVGINDKTKDAESSAPVAASASISRTNSDQDLTSLNMSSPLDSDDVAYVEFPDNNGLVNGANRLNKSSNGYSEVATRPRSNSYGSEKGSDKGGDGSVTGDVEMGIVNKNKKLKDDGDSVKAFDDGIDKLTADEYIKTRLIPVLVSFQNKPGSLSTVNNIVTMTVVTLAVISSIFSAFNLVLFIPITLAFSNALTSWVDYKQVQPRTHQTNVAIQQLNQLIIWWDGLSMIEKRDVSNRESLLMRSEAYIVGRQSFNISKTGVSDDDKKEDEK